MRYFATIFISLFISSLLNGQDKNESGTAPGDLALRIKSISFVKNNEYFSPVIEGYTLLGYFFQPVLLYSPSEKLTLSLGAHFLSYSGTGRFKAIRPVFSTRYRISERSRLILGTLSGSDCHKLFDPHFNSERLYNEYIEDGIQYIYKDGSFFSDTWISWENFIFKGDYAREIFTAGESFRYTSPTFGGAFQVEIPVQIQLKHFGGQISNYPERVETYFNLAAGLKINYDPEGRFPGKTALEYLFFKNNEFTGTNETGISGGNASWLRLHYYYKWLYAGLAYWKSDNFYAPNGNFIYSSLSDYNINTLIPSRSILTNTISINLSPESFLGIFVGLDLYYDTDRNRIDNSIALHLNFNKLIRLATLKQ
jgi:hypothetical protein